MIIHDFPQYSDAWFKARRGVPTASEFSNILTPKTGKLSASAETYACRLIGDLLDLEYPRPDTTATAAMRLGTIMEPEARNFYELEHDCTVQQVGFITTDDGRFGCSPDGIIPDQKRGLELKHPSPHTQVKWLLDRDDSGQIRLPDEHRAQIEGSLIITGYDAWTFMSYVPGLPTIEIEVRPSEYTAKLRAALEEFWAKYQAMLATIRG